MKKASLLVSVLGVCLIMGSYVSPALGLGLSESNNSYSAMQAQSSSKLILQKDQPQRLIRREKKIMEPNFITIEDGGECSMMFNQLIMTQHAIPTVEGYADTWQTVSSLSEIIGSKDSMSKEDLEQKISSAVSSAVTPFPSKKEKDPKLSTEALDAATQWTVDCLMELAGYTYTLDADGNKTPLDMEIAPWDKMTDDFTREAAIYGILAPQEDAVATLTIDYAGSDEGEKDYSVVGGKTHPDAIRQLAKNPEVKAITATQLEIPVYTQRGEYKQIINNDGTCILIEPEITMTDEDGNVSTLIPSGRDLNFSTKTAADKYLALADRIDPETDAKLEKMSPEVFNSIGVDSEITVKISITGGKEIVDQVREILGVQDDLPRISGEDGAYVIYSHDINPELLLDVVELEGVSYIDIPLKAHLDPILEKDGKEFLLKGGLLDPADLRRDRRGED